MKPNLYTKTASLYDSGNDREPLMADILFYLSVIPTDASVLEVGCGTGRVSIPLAERGNTVSGIDLSREMLDVFKSKIKDVQGYADRISLHHMDMRDFNVGCSFDYVIFPFRVFQALTSDEDRRACLECVKRHMHMQSKLVLTLFNPKKSILDDWGRKDILEFEQEEEGTGRTIRRYQDQMWHSADKQIISTHIRHEIHVHGKLVETLTDELELGYLYPEQCEKLFKDSRLRILNAFGYYDCRPITSDEQIEQIYILEKLRAVTDGHRHHRCTYSRPQGYPPPA